MNFGRNASFFRKASRNDQHREPSLVFLSAQIIISDKFNFDSIRTITDGISLSNVANDFGMVLQTLGMIQEFSIRIEVEMDDI